MKTNILRIAGLLAFFFGLLYVSNMDYKETVIYNMPNTAYMEIYNRFGHGCTEKQIIDEYLSNKNYYDSLNNNNYGITNQ